MRIEVSTINTFVTIALVMLAMTFTRSILVMVGGKNLFKKASKKESTAFYPLVNLFTLLDITETSTFLGILFFVPIVNVVVLSILFYRLGSAFNTSMFYKIGLVVLPIIFYPILAFGDKAYKLNDEEYFKALDNAKGESINLMTQEEIKAENNAPVEEKPPVDSIFKSDIEMMEEVAPYKAAKVDLLGMEKLKQSTPQEEMFKPIEQVAPPEPVKEEQPEEQQKPQSKFTTELDKKDEVEFIDL